MSKVKMISHIKTIPFLTWLIWYIRTKILLLKNKRKFIKIYACTRVYKSQLSEYNTFYNNVLISECKIGRFVYISADTIIVKTNIGSFCSIGPGCRIGLGMHPTNHISTFPAFFSTAKQSQISFTESNLFKETEEINIGSDVWMGANTIILDGIKIGNGAIIAAGAVVVKDVPAYAIVGGVPAKIIKYRFTQEQIIFLENFQWWNKNIEWIKKNACLFSDPNQFFNFNEQ